LPKSSITTSQKKEKVILISVIPKGGSLDQAEEYLDELAFLAQTAGATEVKRFHQKLIKPDSRYYVGSGKLLEIQAFIEKHEIQIAIFDDELTPSQIRNLENKLKCRILDRTGLILDIFASRAQTSQARTQVELAQYQYLLPRLTRMWTHLEKQRGGIGLRGPGETEIETDRRVIRDKLARLKAKLGKIDQQNLTRRKQRSDIVRVALVGYTHVGKSTLMNLLTKSKVFAENKLFATLDTTVRKAVWENIPFLLSDTVGFIRKLPHNLIESFKSTLDEVVESDILLHIVDISHKNFEEHMSVVNNTLVEIGARDKPMIMVFNKIDLAKMEEDSSVFDDEHDEKTETKQSWGNSWVAKENQPAIFISAAKNTNIPELREILMNEVKKIHNKRYPQNQSASGS
jgi:GTP-binding protein HflX